jgi:hypothetical protein
VAIPQIEAMIEPGAKDWRWFAGVLRSTEHNDRLRRLRLIARAPNENSRSGRDPERECHHDYDRQYSPNDLYGMFCFRSSCSGGTLHP